MKKLKKIAALFLSLAITCSLAMFFVACGPTLKSVEITTPPTVLEYIEGQTFDPAGMEVSIVYDNGDKEVVTDYTYEPSGALTVDDTEITVTYKGVTATQAITVIAKKAVSIEVTEQPTTVAYKIGDVFDKTGMKVKATYNDESVAEITDYTVKPARPLNANDKNVYVSFDEYTVKVPVTVEAEAGKKYPKTLPVYKARGTTDLAGQEANVNFVFYNDYTVKGLLESGAGDMADGVIGNYISLPGVWEKTADDFYMVLNDFTFDPSTLADLAGLVESMAPDMAEMFNELVAMDPIDIEGCMAPIDLKEDNTFTCDLLISAMGIQAPFKVTGKGGPGAIEVKAGDALEAEHGDYFGLISSSTALPVLSSDSSSSNKLCLKNMLVKDVTNVWTMTVRSAEAVSGADLSFYIACKKDGKDISDYATLEINGKKVEFAGALASLRYDNPFAVKADLVAGENTIKLTFNYTDEGSAPTLKFDCIKASVDLTVVNASLAETK